jgi:phosphatidylglycerophosphatase A
MSQRFADRPVLRFAWLVATWFGCGMVPTAPGTMGSLGAIPLYLLVARGGRLGVAGGALAVTAIGIWAASVVAHDLRKKDPQVVVVDEVAGMLVTMLPMADVSWRAILYGFLLFRLFDVAKPWPTRRFEALPGGWGIVMDDVVAGGFGACVMIGLRAAGALP